MGAFLLGSNRYKDNFSKCIYAIIYIFYIYFLEEHEEH